MIRVRLVNTRCRHDQEDETITFSLCQERSENVPPWRSRQGKHPTWPNACLSLSYIVDCSFASWSDTSYSMPPQAAPNTVVASG